MKVIILSYLFFFLVNIIFDLDNLQMAEGEMMAAASIIPITIAIISTTGAEVILTEEVAAVEAAAVAVVAAVVDKTGRTETEVMALSTEDQGVEVGAEVVEEEVVEVVVEEEVEEVETRATGDKSIFLNLFFYSLVINTYKTIQLCKYLQLLDASIFKKEIKLNCIIRNS